MAIEVSHRFSFDTRGGVLFCRTTCASVRQTCETVIKTLERLREVLTHHAKMKGPLAYQLNVELLANNLGVTSADIAVSFAQCVPAGAEVSVTGTRAGLCAFFISAAQWGLLTRQRSYLIRRESLALQKRSFVMRNIADGDLDVLVELERQCWAEEFRATREMLAERVRAYPEGSFVAEDNGTILGVVYCQRIASADALYGRTWRDVGALHDADGAVGQLIVLNVDTRLRTQGIGAQLLSTAMVALRLAGVERVFGVTLTRPNAAAYALGHGPASAADFGAYVAARDGRGGTPRDAILRFHTGNGARIVGLVPHYRPGDRDNVDNGVLVEYNVAAHHARG